MSDTRFYRTDKRGILVTLDDQGPGACASIEPLELAAALEKMVREIRNNPNSIATQYGICKARVKLVQVDDFEDVNDLAWALRLEVE